MSSITSNDRAIFVQKLTGTSCLPNRALVGGKGWSLARMSALGLRVPPAFVVTTDGFHDYNTTGTVSVTMRDEVSAGIAALELETGRKFGDGPHPLLISVRSGAAISMPGMMDTVLNLGMTDEVQSALASESGDEQFARNTHKRFMDLFIDVVLDLDPREHFPDADASVIRNSVGSVLPGMSWEPTDQLFAAIEAVFRSWNSRRARRYRAHQGISDHLGTAVTIQAMVFGNLDEKSGTGVLFSRNPLNGEPTVYSEYLPRAQGEDVVSGRVTPEPLSTLAEESPTLYAELLQTAQTLEQANNEVQDIEFTVQHGTLYLLQSRNAKLAPEASARTSVDLVADGVLSIDQAIARLSPSQAHALVAPHLGPIGPETLPVAQGKSACAGVGSGRVVMDSDVAVLRSDGDEGVILARSTTSPEDLPGMLVAKAVITEEGGSTSHAAVVGRALGLPCVVGCGTGTLSSLTDEVVTVDGGTGMIYLGVLPTDIPSEEDSEILSTLIEWCRSRTPLHVSPTDDGVDSATLLDLNDIAGGADPEQVADVIRTRRPSKTVICGGAIATPNAVSAAIETGVDRIVVSPIFPTLLMAAQISAGDATYPSPTSNPEGTDH